MVRAILEGRKTQTRRIIKAEFGWIAGAGQDADDPSHWGISDEWGAWVVLDQSKPPYPGNGRAIGGHEYRLTCPYGRPGDSLWVRETWQHCRECGGHGFVGQPPEQDHECDNCGGSGFVYRASTDDVESRKYSWKPSIHMSRPASRITLEVTDVRAERLQAITEGDAKAEGFRSDADINGKRAPWVSNPWVWRIAFRVVKP
jgi:hypothetical protein